MGAIEKAIQEIGYRVVYEKVALGVGGITDSSDAQRLEQNLGRMEGVRSSFVNYASSQASVEYNPALVSLADIRKKIADSGYSAERNCTDQRAGLLYPALAGLAMAASSVSVTMSSLALRRWNPSKVDVQVSASLS